MTDSVAIVRKLREALDVDPCPECGNSDHDNECTIGIAIKEAKAWEAKQSPIAPAREPAQGASLEFKSGAFQLVGMTEVERKLTEALEYVETKLPASVEATNLSVAINEARYELQALRRERDSLVDRYCKGTDGPLPTPPPAMPTREELGNLARDEWNASYERYCKTPTPAKLGSKEIWCDIGQLIWDRAAAHYSPTTKERELNATIGGLERANEQLKGELVTANGLVKTLKGALAADAETEQGLRAELEQARRERDEARTALDEIAKGSMSPQTCEQVTDALMRRLDSAANETMQQVWSDLATARRELAEARQQLGPIEGVVVNFESANGIKPSGDLVQRVSKMWDSHNDLQSNLAEARQELAEYQGDNLSRCCGCRFDDGKLTTECLQHGEMRKALEAERAGAGAYRAALNGGAGAQPGCLAFNLRVMAERLRQSFAKPQQSGCSNSVLADVADNYADIIKSALQSTAGASLLAAHAAEVESLKDELEEMSTAHAETVTELRDQLDHVNKACAQELEWRIAVENRADAADKEVAGLRQALEQERARAGAMREWFVRELDERRHHLRNTSSRDHQAYSHAKHDYEWFKKEAEPFLLSTAGQSLLAAHASEVAGLRGQLETTKQLHTAAFDFGNRMRDERDAAVERLRAATVEVEGLADSAHSSGWRGLWQSMMRTVDKNRDFLATLATLPATEAAKPGDSTAGGEGGAAILKSFERLLSERAALRAQLSDAERVVGGLVAAVTTCEMEGCNSPLERFKWESVHGKLGDRRWAKSLADQLQSALAAAREWQAGKVQAIIDTPKEPAHDT